MPIYEYECKACGHQMEALQKISDEDLKDCPVCKKTELIKRVSAPAFHLKGEGWYVTDFRDKDKKKTSEPDTTAVKEDKPAESTTTVKTEPKESKKEVKKKTVDE